MQLKEEDFPIYQQYISLNPRRAVAAIRKFKAACEGGDQEQYDFALDLTMLMVKIPLENITGATEGMRQKTLRSCLAIFDGLAKKGDIYTEKLAASIRKNYINPAFETETVQIASRPKMGRIRI
jgi:hypothetical protein